MSVSIKKIPGVRSVNVNLNSGLVSIQLAPGNRVRIGQIRKSILNDGFTPKDAKVVVAGELVSRNGKLQFRVAGTNDAFPVAVTPHASWAKDLGHQLTINGLLSAGSGESGALQVTSIAAASAGKK